MNRKDKSHKPPISQQMPFTFEMVLGSALASDLDWFNHHPGVRHYIRPYHRGVWPL
jgi:hypothetical protein